VVLETILFSFVQKKKGKTDSRLLSPQEAVHPQSFLPAVL